MVWVGTTTKCSKPALHPVQARGKVARMLLLMQTSWAADSASAPSLPLTPAESRIMGRCSCLVACRRDDCHGGKVQQGGGAGAPRQGQQGLYQTAGHAPFHSLHGMLKWPWRSPASSSTGCGSRGGFDCGGAALPPAAAIRPLQTLPQTCSW